MANVTFNNATIKPRGDTASNWSSANPILAKNEVGYDETNKKFKIGDGTTPWNSLAYCNEENTVNLEPINIGGSVSFDGDFTIGDVNITEEHYQQFLQNKNAPLNIGDYIFQLDTLTDNGDNNYFAQYYYVYLNLKYYVAVCWETEDLYIDETYGESVGDSVNLEPIKISGSYDWENYENTLEFTEENYQQFLKNKTAPIAIDNEIYNLSYIGSEYGNEYYYYYKRITEEKIYTLSIGWNPIDYGYSDEQFVDEISSSVSGKAVLSYTMSPDDVIQLSEEAKTTINKYGVENIIFKINDGTGYTYYLELSRLTDDPLYRYEYLDADNTYYYIGLETDFSSITFIQTSIAPESGSEAPIWQPSTGTFMLNAEFYTKDWYVGFPINCEKGEHYLAVSSANESEIFFSTLYEGGEDVNGAYFNVYSSNLVSKMEYYTTTNELVIYKLSEDSFSDIQEFHDKYGDVELAYVNNFGVSFVELFQSIPINSANINDYINPRLQPINAKLNELDDSVNLNNQEITSITEILVRVDGELDAHDLGLTTLETRVQTLESNSGSSSAITDFTGATSFPENLIIDSEGELGAAVTQELKSIDKFKYTDPNVGITAYFTLTSKIDLSDGNKNWGYLLFTTTINHPIDGIYNCYFQCNETVTYVKYYAIKVS